MDTEPPRITFVFPDSGSTNLAEITSLRVAFSEKMDRQPATGWLHFFPDQRIKKTKWKGAAVAEVILEEPLPADTLIVVEIAGGMRDAHKVKSRQAMRYPLATTDTIAQGSLAGILLLEGEPVKNGVVELFGLEPDSLEYFQRPLIRRAETNDQGAYTFNWLPVPSGPFVARAFSSKDGSLRPGERDPQRILPDTLAVTQDQPVVVLPVTTLYPFDTPGRLLTDGFTPPAFAGQIMAFTMQITDSDTGYYPQPSRPGMLDMSILQPDTGGIVSPVKPGVNRLIAFVDLDADSSFSAVPDTMLGSILASSTDTLAWYFEPWTMVENLKVEPGLDSTFSFADWPDTLVPAPTPAPPVAAEMDSLAAALGDTLAPAETLPDEGAENVHR